MSPRARTPTVPPVPALPKELPAKARSPIPSSMIRPVTSGTPPPPPIPGKSHRRASTTESTGPEPSRTVPPRPATAHGRGKSVDAGAVASPVVLAAQRAAGAVLVATQSPPRPESRSSVNFSYPISPRSPDSPSDDSPVVWSSPPRTNSEPAVRSQPQRNPAPGQSDVEKVSQGKKQKKLAAQGNAAAAQPTLREKATPAARPASASADLGLRGHYNLGASIPPAAPSENPANPQKRKKKKKLSEPTDAAAAPRRSASADLTSAGPYYSDLDTISEDGDMEVDGRRGYKPRPGRLVKHPSVVRENRELEEEADDEHELAPARERRPSTGVLASSSAAVKSAPSGSAKQSQGAQSSARSTGQQTAGSRTASSAQPGGDAGVARKAPSGEAKGAGRGPRPQSLSPTRYAHFATSTPTSSPLAFKHEPPPRSVSPAKSALRKSTSSRSGSAASQASNTGFPAAVSIGTDAATAESGSTHRRKTSRVSFDEESVVIEDESTSAVKPFYQEPTTGGAARTDNLGGRRDGGRRPSNDLEEGYMKPRPALPSFGSIRRQKDKDSAAAAAAPSGATQNSPGETKTRHEPKVPLEASGDHAIGGILAQDLSSRQSSSVKDDVADSGRSEYQQAAPSAQAATGETGITSEVVEGAPPSTGAPAGQEAVKEPTDPVPSIEFIQPTPVVEQTSTMEAEGSLLVPSEQLEGVNPHEDSTEPDHVEPPKPTPALAGLAEPEPEEVARTHARRSPVVGHVADTLLHQAEHRASDDSEEENGSLYSDAPEDPALGDGDGFGSIDAVVDSPTVDSAPGDALTTASDSPPRKTTANGIGIEMEKPTGSAINGAAPGGAGGWSAARAYWSDVRDGQKQDSQKAVAPVAETPLDPPPKARAKKRREGTSSQEETTPRETKLVVKGTALGSTPPAKNVNAQRVVTGKGQPRKADSRPSDVGAVAQASAPRVAEKATRQDARPTVPKLDTGAQEPAPRKAAAQKTRPSSSAAPPRGAFDDAVRNEIHRMGADRPATAASTAHKKGRSMASLRRKDSDSSASSSSFRKRRPRSTAEPAVSLRRTMRPEGQATEQLAAPAVRASSFSARSLSPAGSGRRPMRSSLRGQESRGAPSLRPTSADAAKPPSSFRGFGRPSKAASTPKRPLRSSRRFSDSSDDATPLPAFRSRYEDSSDDDEELPQTSFAPVRGIPRRIGEENEDSSELSDSSDEEATRPHTVSPRDKQTAKPRALTGGTLRFDESARDSSPKGDKRAEKKQRRSFFSTMLGRRHHSDQAAEAKTPRSTSVGGSSPSTKVNGFANQTGSMSVSISGGAPRPTLAQRNSSLAGGESWPIPASSPQSPAARSSPAAADAGRPTTSDGVPRRFPWFGGRTSSIASRDVPSTGTSPTGTDVTTDDRFPRERLAVPERVNEEDEDEEKDKDEEDGAVTDLATTTDGDVDRVEAHKAKTKDNGKPVYGRRGKKKKFSRLRRLFGIYD